MPSQTSRWDSKLLAGYLEVTLILRICLGLQGLACLTAIR